MKQQVIDVVAAYELASRGPTQGSEEWYNIRKGKIGGSEVGCLLGYDPYLTRDAYIRQKRGPYKKIESLPCSFGTNFEEIALDIFERYQGTYTQCKGISLVDTFLEGFMYSPDGIAVLPVDKDNELILNTDFFSMPDIENIHRYVPVLLEIKCPISRVPKGTIEPKKYMAQVQAGMMVIPIVNRALFIDNIFRMCSIENFKENNSYSTHLHSKPLPPDMQPVLFGIFYIYNISLTQEDTIVKYSKRSQQRNYPFVRDFGNSNYNIMMGMFAALQSGSIRVVHSDIMTEPSLEEVDSSMLGVLCWKYFGSYYVEEYRKPHEAAKIIAQVEWFFGRDVMSSESELETSED